MSWLLWHGQCITVLIRWWSWSPSLWLIWSTQFDLICRWSFPQFVPLTICWAGWLDIGGSTIVTNPFVDLFIDFDTTVELLYLWIESVWCVWCVCVFSRTLTWVFYDKYWQTLSIMYDLEIAGRDKRQVYGKCWQTLLIMYNLEIAGRDNNIVIVEKKDGSLRICIDPKELNESIQRQYKTVPTPEEISSKLCGNEVFTVIDMADCYWHHQNCASSILHTVDTNSFECRFGYPVHQMQHKKWLIEILETFRVSLLYMKTYCKCSSISHIFERQKWA